MTQARNIREERKVEEVKKLCNCIKRRDLDTDQVIEVFAEMHEWIVSLPTTIEKFIWEKFRNKYTIPFYRNKTERVCYNNANP